MNCSGRHNNDSIITNEIPPHTNQVNIDRYSKSISNEITKLHIKRELSLSKSAFESGDQKKSLNHFMNALMYKKMLEE